MNSLLRSTFSLSFALLAVVLPARADDQSLTAAGKIKIPQLLITPNRYETPAEKVGRSVDVRGNDEIEAAQASDATRALQTVPGLRMFDLGGPGSPGVTPIEIRGFRTSGTQLLFNGMKLSDPSSISGTYEQFFSYLLLDDIDSVEVLKGGAGVLYGSDSQGGAVNLISRTPSDGWNTGLKLEGGSFNTFQESARLGYGSQRGGILGAVSREDSDGLDAHGNYENTTLATIADYDVIPGKLRISPVFRMIDATNDLNSSPTPGPNGTIVPDQDTEKNKVDARGALVGISADYKVNPWLNSIARVYYNNVDREFFFDFSGFESRSKFQGDALNLDLQNIADVSQLNSKVTLGLEYERQGVKTDTDGLLDDESREQQAVYLFDQTGFFDDLLTISGGGRLTHIGNIDKNVSTLEASGVLKVPPTGGALHSSIAQAFRAPTLFETNGDVIDFNTGQVVGVGNPNLDEEQSTSWDVGYRQPLFNNKLEADVTYFQTDAQERILFDFFNETHVNGGDATNRGTEFALTARPSDNSLVRVAYTNLAEAEGLDGRRQQRRPRNWYAASGILNWQKFTLFGEVRYRDAQQLEFFGMPDRLKEDGYTVMDAAVTYHLTSNVDLFVRADNIFDANYTEAGYTQPGASAFAGVKYRN